MQVSPPMILASDLASSQSPDKKTSVMMSMGVSQSSLMGDKSYSLTGLVWSTFDQFALSGGVTKMGFEDGKLDAIHSYSTTMAYLKGTIMTMEGYTYIKPHPTLGTYGYNVGLIELFMRNAKHTGYDMSLMSSFVAFWTRPYQYSTKVTLSPQVFIMNSPLAWNTTTGASMVTRNLGYILGCGYDYKVSKRFGFSASYKASIATKPDFLVLHNFQIGSKLVF